MVLKLRGRLANQINYDIRSIDSRLLTIKSRFNLYLLLLFTYRHNLIKLSLLKKVNFLHNILIYRGVPFVSSS